MFRDLGENFRRYFLQITIRQTDQSVMDFEGIKFWLASQYQPAVIHDEVTLNAHFAPSSSPVVLAITEPVVNCNTDSAKLEMRVKDFNRQFKNLRNVGVQYRFAGNTQWTTLHTWVTDKADSLNASYDVLPPSGDLLYAVKMESDLSYPQGQYEFRAFTTTPYGNEQVQVYSDIVAVTKDRTRPTNLYTPAPANGILGYGDQLAIEFNEDIVPGYVGADNVIVTARLNQDKVDHEVAATLQPMDQMPRTANPVFLSGDYSIEFWLKWEDWGTILHHGAGTDNLSLAIDDEGYVTATIAGKQFTSKDRLPRNEWTFFALNYKSATKRLNGMAVYGEKNVTLFNDEQVPLEALQAVSAAADNYLYLGDVFGDMHSLALYNVCRDANLAIAEKDVAKDNYEYGLANFWPMDEGHGSTAADLRHTHDFTGISAWDINNVNYALNIVNPKGVAADISLLNTSRGDSYAVELWYLGKGEKDEAVFETTADDPTGDRQLDANKLKLYFNEAKDLVLQHGAKEQTVASHENFSLTDAWHHYALNVQRGQAASFYVDGQRTAVIAEADVPALEGSRLKVGQKSRGAIMDELRIWKASLSEQRIVQNIYSALDTADIYTRGLVAYYPIEKQGTENGVATKVLAVENLAPAAPLHKNDRGVMVSDSLWAYNAAGDTLKTAADWAAVATRYAPPLKNAPDERKLTVSTVASERKVIINLTGATYTPRQLEGRTLNITVDKVRDLHGNTSLPIRWTAYVEQNTLKWTRDSVNVMKMYGDDYTFDVDIENQSGNTELYTLYNMPQWLSVVGSEPTDELSPLQTKTLRFRVDPLVAVGQYDVTIGLQGNNQILEPLRVVMKVSGEAPDWTVDPTEYQHQMTIIGQVYLNGILMENPESMVAAFIGGECRGVAQPKQVRGAAYVTMNVYGNDTKEADQGKTMSFRIWDASKGVAYTNANISEGVVKVYDNPKVEFKYIANGNTFNDLQDYLYMRILDPNGNVVKDWFEAAKANTVTYPYGYTIEIWEWFDSMGFHVPIDKYAFTLDKNMTIACNLQTTGTGGGHEYNAEFTAYIESSSDVKYQEGVVFKQDAMLGNYNTPVIWTKSDDVEQQVPVHQNWNWIAFGVEPESQYLDHVFSDLADWQLLLKSREAMNDYNGAEWGYGTLTAPTVNEMYKLRITRLPSTPAGATVPSVMTVSGRQPVAAASAEDAAKLTVTLAQGWNWIAYTPLTTMTIGEALAAASPQPGDIVKSQTGVAIYDQNGWEGTLTALEGGHGYMYYSVDGETKSFVWPAAPASSAPARLMAPRRAAAEPSIFSPIDPTLYPNNMTMVIRLVDGETVVDTCEVAAFVDGECRGATRASQNGLYYLVIAGDGAGQAMTLRTCLDGQTIDLDKTLQFVSDDNIGTTWDPYVIDLSNLVNGIHNITADDTDDGDWWTLQGFKIGRKPTVPGVYIHHGQKVTIRRNK